MKGAEMTPEKKLAAKHLELVVAQLAKALKGDGGAPGVAGRMRRARNFFSLMKRRKSIDLLTLLEALAVMEVPPANFFYATFGPPDLIRWLEGLVSEHPSDPQLAAVLSRIERLVAEREEQNEQPAD